MQVFLEVYRETGNVTKSALIAKVSRRRHYYWLEGEAYSEAFEDAQEHAVETLEEEARRRAIVKELGSNNLCSTRASLVGQFVNILTSC